MKTSFKCKLKIIIVIVSCLHSLMFMPLMPPSRIFATMFWILALFAGLNIMVIHLVMKVSKIGAK